ncbi:MAG: deacylase [Porticoccaceae bacterium]|nr:deacylase [Porticoccaceae bacterium]
MAMAITLQEYLKRHDVDYEEVTHPREASANRIAEQAHLSGERIAKAVLIKGDTGYRVVVLPSTYRADLSELSHHYHERLGLATESEVTNLFGDCDPGAVPALAQAYGVRVVYDETLMTQPELYLEAGDHETLVRVPKREFHRLMLEAEHGHFGRHI